MEATLESPETLKGLLEAAQSGVSPHSEPVSSRMTREQRALTRELCHLGIGERGLVQKEIVVCDAEIHGQRPAMALGLPGTVFSLAQKLPLNQRFSSSLLL